MQNLTSWNKEIEIKKILAKQLVATIEIKKMSKG